MADVQKENGYTGIANPIIEALATQVISPDEWRVLMVIFRKTYGWGKKEDSISLSQFVEMTKITKPHICRAIQKLIQRNIITRSVAYSGNLLPKQAMPIAQSGNEKGLIYGIQKDFEKWKPLPKRAMLPKQATIVAQIGNASLPKQGTTKETTTKETITKEKPPYPPWLSIDVWKGYIESRKKLKSPMTNYAEKLALEKLSKFMQQGMDPNEVIKQSIENGWKGLFQIKASGVISEKTRRTIENLQRWEEKKENEEQEKVCESDVSSFGDPQQGTE